MVRTRTPNFLFLAAAFALPPGAAAGAEAAVRGELRAWSPVTLDVSGPRSSEDADPNPFLDFRLEVELSNGEARYVVPGFFAADGDAAESGATAGDVWRARFVPDRPGTWRYHVSLRRGAGIALSADAAAGEPAEGDGLEGTFDVAPDPAARGLLRYTGERYLRFAAAGEPFLKGGADSPENFLAYAELDGDHDPGAPAAPGAPRAGEAAPAPRHRYEPHLRDWRPGDPSWRGGRGKGIIGALNYLASRGANSVYFLTMNIAGDGDDVWPYRSKRDRRRFDCSKLDQWEVVFSHMDRLGIMLHVILTETENESLFEVEEGGDFADTRKLYYRELVARFGHHRAIVWNLGEENGWDDRNRATTGAAGRANTHAQRKAFADHLRALDPYDRPIVVHTLPGRYDEIYTPLLGHPSIEGPSLQVQLGERIHSETATWIDRSRAAGRPWFVMLDEIGPADTGVKPDDVDPEHDDVRRHALWGNLMAGGSGCEWYFGYKHPHNDLNLEDFRSRERMWDQTRHALEFFRRHVPFTEMAHADELARPAGVWCLAAPGRAYVVYLPRGGDGAELWLPEAAYTIAWFDPRGGGELRAGPVERVHGGGHRALGAPPSDPDRDWVALVRLEGDPPASVPPPPAR